MCEALFALAMAFGSSHGKGSREARGYTKPLGMVRRFVRDL